MHRMLAWKGAQFIAPTARDVNGDVGGDVGRAYSRFVALSNTFG